MTTTEFWLDKINQLQDKGFLTKTQASHYRHAVKQEKLPGELLELYAEAEHGDV